MASRAHPVGLGLGLGLVAALGAGGCVEAFDGSNVQIDFAQGVQTSTRPGGVPQPDQPPANTHYELYAADQTYQLGPDGQPLLDPQGQPLLDTSFLFKVTEFEISPVIDTTSPCLIELEDSDHPGLHVTEIANQVKIDTGVMDPYAAPAGTDPRKITDVLNAIRRVENLTLVEQGLKSVTSYDPFRYPATRPGCPPTTTGDLPAPSCRDDASNARRLNVCRGLWAQHPDFYEGSDKVFTLPLNGRYLGMVSGTNPLNSGFVGGSSLFVDENLVGHQAYLVNWQYDDPTDVPAAERNDTGFVYMVGRPLQITRGVTTVPLRHPIHPSLINADLAILTNLGHDDVHF